MLTLAISPPGIEYVPTRVKPIVGPHFDSLKSVVIEQRASALY